MISDILKYEFLQNTIIAGLVIGLIAPVLGVFIVFRRLSLIADALSHVSLSGVAVGLFLNQNGLFISLNPIYMGTIFSVLGALLIERLRRLYRHYQEISIPIIMSIGIGVGAVFMSLLRGGKANLLNYLFGSVSAISKGDVFLIIIIAFIVLIMILFFYETMLSLSFDEEHARIIGINERLLQTTFIILVAIVISISVKLVGVLLISSLMTLPIAAAMRVAKSFRHVIWLAVIYAELAVIFGLIISYYVDIAPGGTIVLLSSLFLIINIAYKKISNILLKKILRKIKS